jgi:hypothetical protein
MVRPRLVALVLGLTVTSACGKPGKGTPLTPSASAATPSESAAAMALPAAASREVLALWNLTIDPRSTVHVEMSTPLQHFLADTSAAKGDVNLRPTDLTATRGMVDIDLKTFATHTFGTGDDTLQTAEARRWFQIDDDKEDTGWAHFTISSLEAISATDLTSVAPTTDGALDVRTVTMTVRGDFVMHEHKVTKAARVEVSFRHPHGAPPGSKPTRVDIKSLEPMKVTRAELDLTPRDSKGKVVKLADNFVGKLADSADVTVNLHATP